MIFTYNYRFNDSKFTLVVLKKKIVINSNLTKNKKLCKLGFFHSLPRSSWKLQNSINLIFIDLREIFFRKILHPFCFLSQNSCLQKNEEFCKSLTKYDKDFSLFFTKGLFGWQSLNTRIRYNYNNSKSPQNIPKISE